MNLPLAAMRHCICHSRKRIGRTHYFHDSFKFVVANSLKEISNSNIKRYSARDQRAGGAQRSMGNQCSTPPAANVRQVPTASKVARLRFATLAIFACKSKNL